jgi:hypothetical protein
MQPHRGRWTLIAGMVLLPALYLALAGVHTGTEPRLSSWEARAQAQAVARNVQAPEDSRQLRQITLHITGMS